MRVAAIYDIHGNLPALEAVLREVEDAGVDEIVVGGDVVPGPMPRETLARLLALDLPVRFIRGNGDRVVLEAMAGIDSPEVPAPYRAGVRWVADQMHEYQPMMSGWPMTLDLETAGLGQVLFCHATPWSDREIFTRRTPDERLLSLFGGSGTPLVVCGHTHMQFDRTIGTMRVVNAGSVGMPFGEPGADWLLLDPGVDLRRTRYDLEAAAARIRATDYPEAEDFAARSVLHPPSEAEMLDAFGGADAE
jgi:putative phosphoesterase